ncbi:substrate-binding domain-containing protein [Methylobacterium sp. A54F]
MATGVPILLFAAGSLRAALTEVCAGFTEAGGGCVLPRFGPSGLLRQAIADGAPAHLFVSADMEQPEGLARDGPVRPLARNRLCLLVRPGLDVASGTALDAMLDPGLRLATSTPGADPSGDYALAVFRRAEDVRPGAFAALSAKALRLTGASEAPSLPAGRTAYGLAIERGATDLFLTYATNAAAALREVPGARIVALPEALAVAATYGLALLRGAPPAAATLADILCGAAGQAVLARHGFAPIGCGAPAATQPPPGPLG